VIEVATGVLSPGQIAPALRSRFRRQPTVRVLSGDVEDIDLERRVVRAIAEDETELAYDPLIVAAGATPGAVRYSAGPRTEGVRRSTLAPLERAIRRASAQGRCVPGSPRSWPPRSWPPPACGGPGGRLAPVAERPDLVADGANSLRLPCP
jgi:NADPH-dependent 2,4-dienoyl-CoA reductase/sulfur reductase-like enzyme